MAFVFDTSMPRAAPMAGHITWLQKPKPGWLNKLIKPKDVTLEDMVIYIPLLTPCPDQTLHAERDLRKMKVVPPQSFLVHLPSSP